MKESIRKLLDSYFARAEEARGSNISLTFVADCNPGKSCSVVLQSLHRGDDSLYFIRAYSLDDDTTINLTINGISKSDAVSILQAILT